MNKAAQLDFVRRLEEGCEYRSEYPGNVGPVCWRCDSCRRIIAEYEAAEQAPEHPEGKQGREGER